MVVTMAMTPALTTSGSVGHASMTADRSESMWGDFRAGFSAGAVSPMGRFRNPLRFRLLALDGLQPSKLHLSSRGRIGRRRREVNTSALEDPIQLCTAASRRRIVHQDVTLGMAGRRRFVVTFGSPVRWYSA